MAKAKSGAAVLWTGDEMMAVAAARELSNESVCFVGIGLPSLAANLARATHAPEVVLIYESGCIGAKPNHQPPSIGDGFLSQSSDSVVGILDLFNYFLQAQRIDVGFLGAAQVDRYGNLNTTVIGRYDRPAIRLPGGGGAPEIATSCSSVIITLRHKPQALVETLDFVTTIGHGDGPDYRRSHGLRGAGPQAIITDLAVLRCDPATSEFLLESTHPGVDVADVVAATGWPLRVASRVGVTAAPTETELNALRRFVGTPSSVGM